MKDRTGQELAMHVSVVSIILNVVLSLFKLLAGVLAHSGAMISDAVHSASDVLSTFAVMAGVKIAGRASDEGHQYGHERMECVFSIVLAVILFATGIGIGISGVQKIMSGNQAIEMPGMLALVAAVASILMKEWMFRYTRRAAKKINSSALMADAWHHRSDSLSSIGSFIGIFGARLGFPILDPIASVVICVFIGKAAWDIFFQAISQMVDQSCDQTTTDKIRSIAGGQDGVQGVDDIKTRLFGAKIYVDIEISADGQLSLYDAHEIAQHVHDEIEQNIPQVKHCMVHVNPYFADGPEAERIE
jgi:cation diffusion facilitator family transporter